MTSLHCGRRRQQCLGKVIIYLLNYAVSNTVMQGCWHRCWGQDSYRNVCYLKEVKNYCNSWSFRWDRIRWYFGGADSRVKMWSFSDVSGNNSVPIFRVCWWFWFTTSTPCSCGRSYFPKRRKTFTSWGGCLSEKILFNKQLLLSGYAIWRYNCHWPQ